MSATLVFQFAGRLESQYYQLPLPGFPDLSADAQLLIPPEYRPTTILLVITDPTRLLCLFADQYKLLLPRVAFRKILRKQIVNGVASHLDMNSGRVRHDLLDRLNNSYFEFSSLLNDRVDTITDNIERAVTLGMKEKAKGEDGFKRFSGDVEGKLKILDGVVNF